MLKIFLNHLLKVRTTENNGCLGPGLYQSLHGLYSNSCTYTRETDKFKMLIINTCAVRHTGVCVYLKEYVFFQQGNSSTEVLHL